MSSPGPSSRSEPETDGNKSEAEICSLLEEAMGDVANIENADVESSNNEFVIVEEIGPSSGCEPETDGSKSEAQICSELEEAMGNAGNSEKADLKSSNREILLVPEMDVHEVSREESSIKETEDFPSMLPRPRDESSIEKTDFPSMLPGPREESSIEETEDFQSMLPRLEAMEYTGNIAKAELKSSNREIIHVPEMDVHELSREESSIEETEDFPSMLPGPSDESSIETDFPSILPGSRESSIEETDFPSMIPGQEVSSDKSDFKLEKPKQLDQPKLKSEEGPAPSRQSWVPVGRHRFIQQMRQEEELLSLSETTEQVVDVAPDKSDFKLEKPKQLKQPKLKSKVDPAPSVHSRAASASPGLFMQQQRLSLEDEELPSPSETEQLVGVASNLDLQPRQVPETLSESQRSQIPVVAPISPDPMQQEKESLEEQACKGEAASGNKGNKAKTRKKGKKTWGRKK